ncbi:MAG: hypothetical protein M1820_004980 [Bogoriella megaspora]|nr:MAG: hypothetical protein M1820_004980 [Bogoriella megaspora]
MKLNSAEDSPDMRSTKRTRFRSPSDDPDDPYLYKLEQHRNAAQAFHKPFEDSEGNMEKLIEKVNAAATPNKHLRIIKLVAVVQGTGGGKSKLLDEFSKEHITATCQLFSGSSVPPPDVDAVEFFKGKYKGKPLKGFCRENQASRHAVCIAFIYALMVEFSKTLHNMKNSGSSHKTALDLHNGIFSTPATIQNINNDGRPLERQLFYERVVDVAKTFYEEHCLKDDWVAIFNRPLNTVAYELGRSKAVNRELFKAAADLVLIAKPERVHIHFDGIAQLVEENEDETLTTFTQNGHQYRALLRIVAELNNYNLIWIISTTNTRLGILAPGRVKEDNDSRKCDRDGGGTIPLIRTESMIPTIRRKRPSELRTEDYSKSSICNLNILKTIGRRLWSSFDDPYRYCKDRATGTFLYIESNPSAALALLGHRVPLWKNDLEKGWVDEMYNALKDYMHLLDGGEVDEEGFVVLASQPEPILTMAVCDVLMQGRNWRSVFRAYAKKARSSNYDKGEQGEQIASIIICCALDIAYDDTYSDEFPWNGTITLGCFLNALLGAEYRDCLEQIPTKIREMWTTAKAIKSIPQDNNFSDEQFGIWQLLHHTGVRYQPGHLLWDCSIPFCSNNGLKLNEIYHLHFQYKNKTGGPTGPGEIPDLKFKDWQILYPHRRSDSPQPLIKPLQHESPANLVFIIDLNSKPFNHGPIQLQLDKRTQTYLLHITGYSQKTYRCLRTLDIREEDIASILHAGERPTVDKADASGLQVHCHANFEGTELQK